MLSVRRVGGYLGIISTLGEGKLSLVPTLPPLLSAHK